MGDLVKVQVAAKAYDKFHPKTALSQFENDLSFVTREELDAAIKEVKKWVIDVILMGAGTATDGGDVNAGDVLMRALAKINKKVFGGNVADRDISVVTALYNGGDITDVEVQ